VNEQVGGEDAGDGLAVHYRPDGLPMRSRSSTLRNARSWSRVPFRAAPRQGLCRLSPGEPEEACHDHSPPRG
jgi:hypothetical protein